MGSVSVVVPTFHRRALLERCLGAILDQASALATAVEVIVADDGGDASWAGDLDPRVVVVGTGGVGPGRARNAAVAVANGDLLVFTDDDAVPEPGWLESLVGAMDAHATWCGARGVVVSPPFDPLYEHSVEDATGGGYLTCNVAYRRAAFGRVGGFDPGFARAHEDRDLGYRMEQLGPVGLVPEAVVTHPARPFTVREWARRGRFVTDDWLLYARYPDQARGVTPDRWKPLEGIARRWVHFARQPTVLRGSARRAVRLATLAAGQLAVGAWVTATARRGPRRAWPVPRGDDPDRALSIAYLGPVPNPTVGGAPGVAGLLFGEVVASGCTVDVFVPVSKESDAADAFAGVEGITVHTVPSNFAFGRWYSSHPITKMLSAQVATARGRQRAARQLLAVHAERPFDVLYQFSTVELFGLSRRAVLPPIVTHPSVHAAGELRWLRAERGLARVCQGRLRPALVRAWVASRTLRQRRDIGRATTVLAISEVFGAHLVADYGVDPERVTVVRNVVDVDLFTPGTTPRPPGPLRVLVLGRITVRKGLEDVVAVTERLSDLAGTLTVDVVGDHSLWSDYRPLLTSLPNSVATYRGHAPRAEVARTLSGYDLLLQLSHYEPFGLTVAEALAAGVPVVATTEVGAAEGIDPAVCTVVGVGDVDAVEAAIRAEVARRGEDRAARSALARAEALRTASAPAVGPALVAALRAAAAVGRQ